MFATLGIGFAVRPLGGIIGGYLGDKIGRKPVLVGSLFLMGFATVLIGVLPTYQMVGIWAPILLVIVRVVQGLAFGAEWGGAILMVFQRSVAQNVGSTPGSPRRRSRWGCRWPNPAFLASVPLGDQWAWRVPFLLERGTHRRGHYYPAQNRRVAGIRGTQGGGPALQESDP